MARPREFEIEDALEAAACAFWSQGYEATSLDDLMAATGLHKGSLYKAFGSKHELFMSAVAHYLRKLETFHRESIESAPSAKAGLRRLFERAGELGQDETGRCRGCLAINTIAELGNQDGAVMELLWGTHGRMIALLTETISRGQATGDLRADLDAGRAARLIFSLMAGFIVGMKAGIPQEQALDTVDLLIEQFV